MLKRLRAPSPALRHLDVALFVALGGTIANAATTCAKNIVGRQAAEEPRRHQEQGQQEKTNHLGDWKGNPACQPRPQRRAADGEPTGAAGRQGVQGTQRATRRCSRGQRRWLYADASSGAATTHALGVG